MKTAFEAKRGFFDAKKKRNPKIKRIYLQKILQMFTIRAILKV